MINVDILIPLEDHIGYNGNNISSIHIHILSVISDNMSAAGDNENSIKVN